MNAARSGSITEVLLRQIAMLRLVPRHPRTIGTAELRARLAERGFSTTSRTIQRDLHTLATFFALECHAATRPYGWRWRRDADLFEVPPMDRDTATALLLAGTAPAAALSSETAQRLAPHLAHARGVLGIDDAAWSQRFRVMTPRRATVPSKVLDVLVRALVEERCLRCTYESNGAAHSHDVHPLALVVREASAQVVCTLGSTPRVLTLAAHRIRAAELLAKPRVVPRGFELDDYLRDQPSRAPRGG